MNEESHKKQQSSGQSHPPSDAASPTTPIQPPPSPRNPQGGKSENGAEGRKITTQQEQPSQNNFWRATLPEWLMAAFTAGIFFATVVYAGVTRGQLKAMNDQLWEQKHEGWATSTQLKGQLAALNGQVNAQATTAAAAKSAADTAANTLSQNKTATSAQLAALGKSIDEQSKAARASEKSAESYARSLADNESVVRARVDLSGSVNHTPGGTINVGIGIRNFGQTPARQVRAYFVFFHPGKGTEMSVAARQKFAFNLLMKSPLQWLGVMPAGSDKAESASWQNVSADDWEYLKQTPGGWTLVAQAKYLDIFGRAHWTHFCSYQAGHDFAMNCPAYNGDDSDYSRSHRASVRSAGKPGETRILP